MGHSIDEFVDTPINKGFLCSICHNVLQSPKMAEPCQHLFCEQCIGDWQMQQEEGACVPCPVDECEYDCIEGLSSPQRVFMDMLNELRICCPFREQGCPIEVALGDLDTHKLDCEFNPTMKRPCPGECGASFKPFTTEAKQHSCVWYLTGKLVVSEQQLTMRDTQLEGLKAELKRARDKLEACEEQLVGARTDLRSVREVLQQRNKELARARAEIENLTTQTTHQIVTEAEASGASVQLIRNYVSFTVPQRLYDQVQKIVTEKTNQLSADEVTQLQKPQNQQKLQKLITEGLTEGRIRNVASPGGNWSVQVCVILPGVPLAEHEDDLIIFGIENSNIVIKIQ